MRGNVINLSVAVVVGTAFAKAINSINDILISPLVGILSGSGQFLKDRYGNLSQQNAAGLSADEVMQRLATSRYGVAIDIVNFIVVAFIAFLFARWFGKYFRIAEVAARRQNRKNC